MIDVTLGIRINRPVENVFAYVTDIVNDPSWHTDILEAKRTTEGPIGVGTTYEVRIKPSMGVSGGIVEVVEFEPTRKQVLRSEMGRMRPTVTYLFEPADGGTNFTRRVQIELSGPIRLMQPFIRAMGKKRNTAFLANLKRVLEEERPDLPA
jgi:uncharacterized protein YndB with AHSA1/START domain